jgi:hypothetical protein
MARNVFIVWVALVIPWAAIAPLSEMAFDGGRCWSAYLYVWSVLTYPICLIVAWTLRRVAPFMMWLPLFNLIGFFVGGLAHGC